MLFSIQAFSQNTDIEYTFTDNEIKRIIDSTYIFFIYDNIVYSETFSTKYIGIVKACDFLDHESKLSKQDINLAFDYLRKWWNYSKEFSSSIPTKNNLSVNIKELLSSNNEYSKIIEAIIIIKSEIFKEKHTKEEKSIFFCEKCQISRYARR